MSGNTYLEIIIASSIFVPLTIVVVLAWSSCAAQKNDPDEQRWRRQAEQTPRRAQHAPAERR